MSIDKTHVEVYCWGMDTTDTTPAEDLADAIALIIGNIRDDGQLQDALYGGSSIMALIGAEILDRLNLPHEGTADVQVRADIPGDGTSITITWKKKTDSD